MTTTPSGIPVSVLIPTRNERDNISSCIESLTWSDDIIVVDSQSTDGTADIAKGLGATVVDFKWNGSWPKKKNWALSNLHFKHDWILILDADERATPALASEIGKAISNPGYDGFYVRWKFVFLGRWMKHCWKHGWMLRLFRKGTAQYEDLGMRGEGGWDNEVHENLVCTGKSGRLAQMLLHDSNKSLSEWIAKQNQFSDWNAARRAAQLHEALPSATSLLSRDPLSRRKWLKAMFIRMPCKPILMFIYLYLLNMGFLDGRAGFYFCMLRASHELNTNAKMFERGIPNGPRGKAGEA